MKLKMRPAEAPQHLITSDQDVATWKTIKTGTFRPA
jgi:hypothetical protein